MKDLYDLNTTDALGYAIEEVMNEHPELTKTQAKKLVLNALVYNCVVAEITGQVNFLLGIDDNYDEF